MPARLTPEEVNEYLDSKPGWIVLTTIGPDGFPHSVPLGYFRHDESVFLGMRDNTTKVRNVEANPKVSLMVESGSTMGEIKGVMIQGNGRVHRAPEKVLEIMRLGAAKRGVAEADLPSEARPGSVYVEVVPVRTISWDYGR